MSFVLSNEQKLIEHEIQKFASAELGPIAGEIDEKAVCPRDIIRKLTDLGFLGILIPEEFGGAGLDTVSLCIVLRELSRDCASVGVAVAAHSCLVTYPILRYASSDLKTEQLPGLAGGSIGAFSAVDLDDHEKNLEVRESDGTLFLSGTCRFVFNGEQASNFVVPAAHKGNLFHFVGRDNTITTEPQYLLGLRAAGIVTARFNNTVLGGHALIDAAGATTALRDVYAFADIGFAAVALGIAEACFDAAIEYSRGRRQFNRSICEFPMVQAMLVDMKKSIDAARLLVFEAARLCDSGNDFVTAAHVARLHACATAENAGTTSVQIHGGYGYTKDYPVERYFRDAKSMQVLIRPPHEITSVLAKELLV
jgi:alkylation response protein AidB-like acyl-CoA dehydrogenase